MAIFSYGRHSGALCFGCERHHTTQRLMWSISLCEMMVTHVHIGIMFVCFLKKESKSKMTLFPDKMVQGLLLLLLFLHSTVGCFHVRIRPFTFFLQEVYTENLQCSTKICSVSLSVYLFWLLAIRNYCG